jgi:hypothetical protein
MSSAGVLYFIYMPAPVSAALQGMGRSVVQRYYRARGSVDVPAASCDPVDECKNAKKFDLQI